MCQNGATYLSADCQYNLSEWSDMSIDQYNVSEWSDISIDQYNVSEWSDISIDMSLHSDTLY